ncbi:hypothetical protein BH18ACT4_BH18ACT4_03110 [soil metagenome]
MDTTSAVERVPGSTGYSTFIGDCMGMAIGSDGVAHPVWTDTRNAIFSFSSPGVVSRWSVGGALRSWV